MKPLPKQNACWPIFPAGLLVIVIALVMLHGCAAWSQEIVVTNVVTSTNIVSYLPADTLNASPALSHSLQELWDTTAGATNFAALLGGGRGVKGNKNLAFADFIYNLNDNAGLIFGYDYLFSRDKRMGEGQASVVKGGFNLQADIYPLKRWGVTNFFVTPFASVLIATPLKGTDNNGGVAQIALTGIDWKARLPWWGINAHLGGFYESRTGQGNWDGNYLCGHIAFSKGF